MRLRLMEAGEDVSPEEILLAAGDLQKAMHDAGAGGGTIRFGRSGRFRLWRDLSGAGVIDVDTGNGARVSMTIQAVENTAIIQTTMPDDDGYQELHDTPAGGAARTQIKLPRAEGERAYVWRATHYSYGRRWDPTLDQAADNFYHENGKIWCRQRFIQGEAKGSDERPVFEAFRPDGSPLISEHGNSTHGKHRSLDAGYAYQEFHPGGNLAVALFSNLGVQRGPTLFFSPDGKPVTAKPGAGWAIPCSTLTNADSWVAREMAARKTDGVANPPEPLKPFGIALSEALSQHRAVGSRRRQPGKTR